MAWAIRLRRQLSARLRPKENREQAGQTSTARVIGQPRPAAELGPGVVDRVLAFHYALVSHRGPAKLEVTRIGQCFALSFEAQRVSLPIPTDRFMRRRCTIEAAEWIGSSRIEIVRLVH